MPTATFRRVTRALMQILPKGQEGDLHEVQAVVFELIPANSMGYIKFQGILWRARCLQQVSLEPGMRVRVLDREHLTLIVEPIDMFCRSILLLSPALMLMASKVS